MYETGRIYIKLRLYLVGEDEMKDFISSNLFFCLSFLESWWLKLVGRWV